MEQRINAIYLHFNFLYPSFIVSKFALANRRGTAARCILFLATAAMPPDEQGVQAPRETK